ncbi:amiloride-sensitive sodium channel subunit beta-like [Saccostrea echinata]|uniref:amiloride-sensitive sodium channel subunit beta-like n=1 Tax=Saccostrea echinata TaxID=191078 RepID=UPI002A825581|nr:amiloride-sensitive sodium channel subunit beta-like [Saccostrea echinata]
MNYEGDLVEASDQIFSQAKSPPILVLGIKEPTNTIIKNEYGKIAFPKVSFCNLNPMKFSKMLENEKLFKIINETATLTGVDMLDFGTIVEKYLKLYPATGLLGIASTSDARNMFYQRMGELSWSNLKAQSQEKTEFIISCEYQGKPCILNDVTSYRDEFYGTCYRFIPSERKMVVSPGPQGGLTLTLNLEQTEYIPFIAGSAGVIMDITRNEKDLENKIPSMRRTGTLLSPNVETYIALKNVENIRIPGSERKCADGLNNDVAECIEYCVGIAAATVSGCAHEYTFIGEHSLCSSLKEIESNEYVRTHLDISATCSHCKIPCKELIYEKTLSMTTWPIESYIPILKQQLKEGGVNISQNNFFDTSSYMKLHVFFSSLSTTVIEEEESYTFENFLSDIGGQLGLWAGISVLSLAEVVELLVLIVVGFFARKNKTATETESEKDLKKITA